MVEQYVQRMFSITKAQAKWLKKNHPQGGSLLVRQLLDKEMQKPIK